MIPLASLSALALHVAAVPDAARRGFVVHAPALAEVAREWEAYRRADGWTVECVEARAGASAEEVRDELARRLRAASPERDAQVAVLLLGDEACDADARVPTFHIAQSDPDLLGHQRHEANPTFAADRPYATAAADVPCRLALGRVPASTPDEARAILAKVRDYESGAAPSDAADRLEFVAGEARFGVFDPIFEQLFVAFVDECVPPRFRVHVTYAKPSSPWCPPPASMERTVLERLASGALAITYTGHGHPHGLDRLSWRGADGKERSEPILRAEAAASAAGDTALRPVAILSCCSTGWFDRPDGRDSLAEALLANPEGPIAVVAGTRVTHPYANALVVKEYLSTLLASPGATIGEIDRRARDAMLETDDRDRRLEALVEPIAKWTRWRTSLPDLRTMHVNMYVLLGDPMLRVATPPVELTSLMRDGDAIAATLDGAVSGTATVTVETELGEPADPSALQPAAANDDVAARTARNYPLANERVLWRATATLSDGRVRADLPSPLPPRAAVIRVRVDGVRADGSPVRAAGARRVAPVGARAPLPAH